MRTKMKRSSLIQACTYKKVRLPKESKTPAGSAVKLLFIASLHAHVYTIEK